MTKENNFINSFILILIISFSSSYLYLPFLLITSRYIRQYRKEEEGKE